MRIGFVLADISHAGGLQRVLAQTAASLHDRGHDVSVISFGKTDVPFFPLPAPIPITALDQNTEFSGALRSIVRNVRRSLSLRRVVRDSRLECVIAFGDTNGIRAVAGLVGTGIPVLVSEHSNAESLAQTRFGLVWQGLKRLVYPFAAGLVVLTEHNRAFYAPWMRDKIHIIPNAVPESASYGAVTVRALPSDAAFIIASAGRFTEEKGYDLLLGALSRLCDSTPTKLILAGDGPLRSALEAAAATRGLQDRVTFTGFLKDPWPALASADVFVVSSRDEAFPMVLLEAMARGYPVAAFRSPGTEAIVRHGVDGMLVPAGDVPALAETLLTLRRSQELRKRLGAAATEVRSRFSLRQIAEEWERVIRSTLRR